MDILFLGTGSAHPTPCRGASAIAVRREGDVWLFDCGEGTQIQIMKLKLIRPGCISKIFITHLHGDHLFGLPGLLNTISKAHAEPAVAGEVADTPESVGIERGKKTVIELYGPLGLRRFLRESLNLSRSHLLFKYVVHELVPTKDQFSGRLSTDPDWDLWNPDHLAQGAPHICEEGHGRAIFFDSVKGGWAVFRSGDVIVTAGQLRHRIPSFGYVITESEKPGRLMSEELIKFGVPKGPLFGKVKRGERVVLDDGREVDPANFVGPPQPGRKMAILQDSCDSWAMRGACEGCDVLVHEATNEDSHREQCVMNGHSTPSMAAEFALATRSRLLVLTHCSQRYKHRLTHDDVKDDDLTTDILEREARTVFDNVVAAYDGLVVNVTRKSSVT